MPDLGAYAVEVTLAYAVSGLVLICFAAWSVWRARKVARALEVLEARRRQKDG